MKKTKITFINGPIISQEEVSFLSHLDYKIISLTALPTFNSIENIELYSSLSIAMLEHTTIKVDGNKIIKTIEYIIDLPLKADKTIFVIDDSIYSVVREIRNDFISKSKFENNPISYVVKRYIEKTSAKSLK